MARLIVRNSSLVYPPVPDAVYRDGDIVLPLVDRFEEAVFMAGPGYEELRGRFPAFNLQVRARARQIASFLPPWLGEPIDGMSHSVWDAYADHFAKFSLGPLMTNAFLAGHAITLKPDEVVAWELDNTEGWWAGRQMVAEVARAIAAECNARVELSASSIKRALRDTILPMVRRLIVLRQFRGLRSANLPAPEASARPDVLFVVSGPTVVPMVDRIGRRLQAEHGLRIAALETPPQGPSGRIDGGELPRGSLYGFSEPWMARQGIAEALTASEQFPEIAERLRTWKLLAELPEPLADVLVRRLHGTIVSELPVSLYNARLWQRALEALQPRVLISFNSYNEVLAPGVLQARGRGIPTICLQHGIWGPLFFTAALLPYDDIMVFGDYALEMLTPLASEHTRFVKAGHCLYDDLDVSADSGALREQFAADREHLVVVTTQPIELRLMVNEERWWLRGLAEACAQCGAVLAIKPHPQEDGRLLASYEALSRELPDAVRLVRHGEVPLKDLIAASDLLVTRFSTTAFEAALLGGPVMTVNLSGGPDQYPFVEEGGALGVWRYDQIAPTLRALLTDEETRAKLANSREAFLARHLGPRDGRATQRIAETIALRARESPA